MKYRIRKILIISLILNFICIISVGIVLYKKGGITYLKQKVINTSDYGNAFPINYYIEKSMLGSLPQSNNKIVFLGDSLTNFCNWNELFQNNDIINRGITGDTTQGIINRLTDITRIKPSKLFILVGINDLINKVSTDKIYDNYVKILCTMKQDSPHTQIVIQSILPFDNTLFDKNYNTNITLNNKDIVTLNSKLKNLVQNDNDIYIDLYSLFVKNGKMNNIYTIDGVHLNGQGYLIWKQVIEKYVNEQ